MLPLRHCATCHFAITGNHPNFLFTSLFTLSQASRLATHSYRDGGPLLTYSKEPRPQQGTSPSNLRWVPAAFEI
jgi:hypothetical protein